MGWLRRLIGRLLRVGSPQAAPPLGSQHLSYRALQRQARHPATHQKLNTCDMAVMLDTEVMLFVSAQHWAAIGSRGILGLQVIVE